MIIVPMDFVRLLRYVIVGVHLCTNNTPTVPLCCWLLHPFLMFWCEQLHNLFINYFKCWRLHNSTTKLTTSRTEIFVINKKEFVRIVRRRGDFPLEQSRKMRRYARQLMNYKSIMPIIVMMTTRNVYAIIMELGAKHLRKQDLTTPHLYDEQHCPQYVTSSPKL